MYLHPPHTSITYTTSHILLYKNPLSTCPLSSWYVSLSGGLTVSRSPPRVPVYHRVRVCVFPCVHVCSVISLPNHADISQTHPKRMPNTTWSRDRGKGDSPSGGVLRRQISANWTARLAHSNATIDAAPPTHALPVPDCRRTSPEHGIKKSGACPHHPCPKLP